MFLISSIRISSNICFLHMIDPNIIYQYIFITDKECYEYTIKCDIHWIERGSINSSFFPLMVMEEGREERREQRDWCHLKSENILRIQMFAQRILKMFLLTFHWGLRESNQTKHINFLPEILTNLWEIDEKRREILIYFIDLHRYTDISMNHDESRLK